MVGLSQLPNRFSLFQIDLERLESHMQKNLLKGIPFRTKAEFEDVIEHIKTYSG